MHKDYLGSILAISDEAGNAVERRHFDAWGNLTHGTMELLDRGYTSHEHLTGVGIIHMNGRLYDPLLRRFLNADENIQDPTNTQNYNKYGYVMNNPLMYNDPSGEFIFTLLTILTGQWYLLPLAIGADMGMIQGAAMGGWNFASLKTWGYMLGGAAIGGISGAAGAWVGQAALLASGVTGGILGGVIAGTAGGAVGGAISGAGFSAMAGQSIGRGLVQGMVTGAVGGAVIGGVVGGVQQGLANAKVDATGIGEKGNMITGAKIAPGRGVWSLNNTPKTQITNNSNITTENLQKNIIWEDFKPKDLYDNPITDLERELQLDKNGNWKWPPNNGAVRGTETTATLKSGYQFDRFGEPTGTYGSPLGTSYGERALLPGTYRSNYYIYEVVKDLNIGQARVLPWFGQPGGGIQFRFNVPLQKLIDDKIIRQVFP